MEKKDKGNAPAFDENEKVGPRSGNNKVRDAGGESTRDDKKNWDEVDEAADETFPASDATAKY